MNDNAILTKKETLVLISLVIGFANQAVAQISNKNKSDQMNSITAKDVPAPKENFAGQVWVSI